MWRGKNCFILLLLLIDFNFRYRRLNLFRQINVDFYAYTKNADDLRP